MRVDVDAVCRAALAEGAGGDDLDQRVRRVCRNAFGADGERAAAGVLRVIDELAVRAECSRLEAARRIAQSQTTLEVSTRRWTSLEDLPPDLRKRVEEMKATDQPGVVGHVTTHEWDSSQGAPPPEVAEALRRAIGSDGTVEPGRFAVRVGPSWPRRLALLGLVLLLALGLALLQLWADLREPRGLRHFGKALAELEEAYGESPDDRALGMRLAVAYARKLALVRTLEGLRRDSPWAEETEQAGLLEERLAEMEERTGVAHTTDELTATATAGETLVRDLLKREGLGPAEEGTLQVLLGHFRLALGDAAGARRASARAAELEPADVRPHLLNAAICEETDDYEEGIRENQAALGKLDAWVSKAPESLQYVIWQAGPDPFGDGAAWRRARERLADDVRQQIELHSIILRALASRETLRREGADGPAGPRLDRPSTGL
jgi:hypothetical protein